MRKEWPCRRRHLWPSGTFGRWCAASTVKILNISTERTGRKRTDKFNGFRAPRLPETGHGGNGGGIRADSDGLGVTPDREIVAGRQRQSRPAHIYSIGEPGPHAGASVRYRGGSGATAPGQLSNEGPAGVAALIVRDNRCRATRGPVSQQHGIDVANVHHGRGLLPSGVIRLRGCQRRYF